MGMTLRVVVPPHPLIGHWLSVLRDRSTPPALYATATLELGRWLTYEALRDWLPQRTIPIPGCQGDTEGSIVDPAVPILALPVLRAGLGLWDGARAVIPAARVLHVDRHGRTLPDSIETRCGVLVFTPEIASGDSLANLLDALAQRSVTGERLRVITALASSAGLKLLGERCPTLTIYTACIDAGLSPSSAIDPGIGNVEERLFGISLQARPSSGDLPVDSAVAPA
ncbi:MULTISPECIES: uracil phosphoribosyltransferase [Aphanothece]|uniref:uracil phosphoribosyltransferase n=1 Tax=Aphanothece TaxID=1121 RepID=UPI00398F4D5E